MRRPIDWQWILTVFGVLIAAAVVFFVPALPYKLNNLVSVLLFFAFLAALTWLVYGIRRWRRAPAQRGPWTPAVTTVVLFAGLVVVVAPQQETGYVNVNCKFGAWGFGYGTVWARIEPDDKEAITTVTIKWGHWYGRPDPRRLTETTYFTFLKRDFASGSADISVDPPAKITCGDGRPSDDHPSIHITGPQWSTSPPAAPQRSPGPSPSTPSPSHSALVNDGDDAMGCVGDARRVHQQAVYTPEGKQLGVLELLQSITCDAMWGRLAIDQQAQPVKGWDVALTVMRSGDQRRESYRAQLHTTAFFTGLLRDDGSCFRVMATVMPGVVHAQTPCER
ncbi:hypothetical protein ACQPZX_17685 [Actinoplanes sp. CA-142083]|uniref:hypothetical protein n=1 Tax=Actinoplanes sp. CA-142083 TaxID=3239903 RepID=UPI003D8DB7D5